MVTIDYKKRNKLSRGRGYNHEHSLILNINSMPDWYARRLGGSSTGLPDIVAVNNKASILLAIEAKSVMNETNAYVEKKQIQRCIDIVNMFSVYKNRYVLLSFKFSNSAINKAIIHHFIMGDGYSPMENFEKAACNIGGNCLLRMSNLDLVPLQKYEFDYERQAILNN